MATMNAIGTKPTIGSAKEATQSNQAAFHARTTSNINNVTGDGTVYTCVFPELFDSTGDYNASNGIFTAPIGGRYFFDTFVYCSDAAGESTSAVITLSSSNRDFNFSYNYYVLYDRFLSFSSFIDMDVADTCVSKVQFSGGSKVFDISAGAPNICHFSGYLVC